MAGLDVETVTVTVFARLIRLAAGAVEVKTSPMPIVIRLCGHREAMSAAETNQRTPGRVVSGRRPRR